MNAKSGFTLIELLVTIAVVGILAAVALPSFFNMIQSNRATSEANSFLVLLVTARSEAIKRNSPVTLCTSSNGTSCSDSATWDQGIVMFVDDGAGGGVASNGVMDGTETLFRADFPFSSTSDITGNAGYQTEVTYRANGLPGEGLGIGTFTIVPSGGKHQAKVVISTNGRPKVEPASKKAD